MKRLLSTTLDLVHGGLHLPSWIDLLTLALLWIAGIAWILR